VSLDGVEEVLLKNAQPTGQDPDSGYIYTWYELDGSDIILKGEKDDGTVVNIGVTGPAGAPGADGNRWFSGAGAPAGGLGNDDDLYLNLTNGDVYEKSGGSWSVVGNIKGPQGDTGPTGATGATGPAGPMNVEGFVSETGTVTLPNVTNPTQIYSDSITITSDGDCFVDISLAIKPHAGNNDYEFQVQWDGSFVLPALIEEGKDQSNAQSNWRSQCLDLGNVSAGTYTLALFFSKESASGTAQLKNYTAKVVRYS